MLNWRSFGKAVMEAWPEAGIDGFELQDLAERHGVIRKATGGFNPSRHADAYGVFPAPGDQWYIRNYR